MADPKRVLNGAKNVFSVRYQNVRGLRTKTEEFYLSLAQCSVDLVLVTETWLYEDIGGGEVCTADYQLFRYDRSGKSRGGGVMALVRRNYKVRQVTIDFKNDCVDYILLELTIGHQNVIILLVYFVPRTNSSVYELFFSKLETLSSLYSHELLIVGDFNLPELYNDKKLTPSCSEYVNFSEFFGIKQVNNVKNSYANILDFVTTNIQQNNVTVNRSLEPFVCEDDHHPTLDILVKLSDEKLFCPINSDLQFNFRKADFYRLYCSLRDAEWNIIGEDDIDAAVDKFYAVLYSVVEECVPKSRPQNKYPVWFNKKIINDIKLKDKYRKTYLKTNNAVNKQRFDALRKTIKLDIKRAYKDYLNACELNIRADPKQFWTFIKNKNGNSDIPAVMKNDNEVFEGGEAIAAAFASYFRSVYVVDKNDNIDTFNGLYEEKNFVGLSVVNFEKVSENDVIMAAKRIKSSTSGPDCIPAYVFKGCIETLSVPLCVIFNMCIEKCQFPTVWKCAKCIPLYKAGSGDRAEIKNYRQISVLSVPSKIFEIIVFTQVFNIVGSCISPLQHGFMPLRSTSTNLCTFTQYAVESMEKGLQVDTVYLDLSKAFDRVNHRLLLKKLKCWGFTDKAVGLMQSYLCGRQQFIHINKFKSDSYTNCSGIPQGSNLGPLLFLLFVNDIANVVEKSSMLLYADDIKIYRPIVNECDCISLQVDVNMLLEWAHLNDLSFNAVKCCTVSYSRSRSPIDYNYRIYDSILQRKTDVSDLGVCFSSDLSFNTHVENVVAKANRTLGFIMRNTRSFNTLSLLDLLFDSYVRSRLEYAVVVWSPYYKKYIYAIEKVQRRFLRLKYFRETRVYLGHDVDFLYEHYNTGLLEMRRNKIMVLFLYKVLNGLVDSGELLSRINLRVAPVATRSTDLFLCNRVCTNYLMYSPVHNMMRMYNRYEPQLDIFFMTYRQFEGKCEEVICGKSQC